MVAQKPIDALVSTREARRREGLPEEYSEQRAKHLEKSLRPFPGLARRQTSREDPAADRDE